LRSGDVLGVIVRGVTVLGRPDAQEKLEGVAEVVSDCSRLRFRGTLYAPWD